MAQREISILVHDYVMHQNSGESAGASGSDRAARLRLEFDSSWAGTTKTVYFTDAQGSSSSAKTLGLDDLAEGEEETYEVAIPASALAYPGRATVTVRGIVLDADGETERVITTAAIDLRVLDSRLPETVEELGQVDATAAEQLQAEIDGLKATFLDAVQKTQASATAAATSEANAAASETNAKASETKAQISWAQAAANAANAAASAESAGTSETNAKASEESAATSAAAAATSEANAKASEENTAASAAAAATSETNAKASEESAATGAAAAAESAATAKTSEENAAASEAAAKESQTKAAASEKNAAASEADAAYWASVAEGAAGGGVITFHGRTGAVQPAAGDYTPEMVGADPAGTGAAQAAAQVKTHDEDENAHKALMDQVKTTLEQHTGNTSNPHNVTAEQAGADPSGSAAAVQTNLDTHTGNTSNPHSVTYSQVGAAAASHTHSGSDLTSAVPISKGGTGATTAAAAMTNLGGMLTDMSNAELGLVWKHVKLPSNAYWNSVCYGAGKFVAVAFSTDLAAYSTDGITWTKETLPELSVDDESLWTSVCYGNGKFVAVADNSMTAAYSTDGINWTAATLPKWCDWISICYGGGKFVAVAYDATTAAYSTDGINWTAATLPNTGWCSVCYGNGKFVAVKNNTAAYSTDGINWTAATLPNQQSWGSVCYGDGKFVAVPGGNTCVTAYSTDGINWTAATLPSSGVYCTAVCYGGGKFIVVSSFGGALCSTDGINWTESTGFSSSSPISACYGNGKFVVTNGSSTASGARSNTAAVADATPSAISQLNAAGLARMQLVSYVGTGTYGASNPCSLTFDFAPKVVLYLGASVDNSSTLNRYAKRAMFLDSLTTNNVTGMGFSLDVSSYPSYGGKNEDGKGVHWYGQGSAENQLNKSGTTYYFLALA